LFIDVKLSFNIIPVGSNTESTRLHPRNHVFSELSLLTKHEQKYEHSDRVAFSVVEKDTKIRERGPCRPIDACKTASASFQYCGAFQHDVSLTNMSANTHAF
jgi:hypothetical protein